MDANEEALDAFNPNRIKADLKEKLEEGFRLRDEQKALDPVQERLNTITDYVYKELGVFEPQDVVKTIVKLAQLNGIQAHSGEGFMDGIFKFIVAEREMKSLREEIARHGRNGVTTRLG